MTKNTDNETPVPENPGTQPLADNTEPDIQPPVVIEYVDPGILTPDPDRPPPVSKPEADALDASVRRQGFINAIETDEHDVIIDGNARWDCARRLGIKVPRKVVAGLTPRQCLERKLTENFHRRDRDPIWLGHTFRRLAQLAVEDTIGKLITNGQPQAAMVAAHVATDQGIRTVAADIGVSHVTVLNYIQLAESESISDEFRDAISDHRLSARAARVVFNAPASYRNQFERALVKKAEQGPVSSRLIHVAARALTIAAEQSNTRLADQAFQALGSPVEQGISANVIAGHLPQRETSGESTPQTPGQVLGSRISNLARDLEKLGEVPTEAWQAATTLAVTLKELMHPKGEQRPVRSRPISAPVPERPLDPRLRELEDSQFTLFYVLRDHGGPLNEVQWLERLGYGDDYCSFETDVVELERLGLVVGDPVAGWVVVSHA